MNLAAQDSNSNFISSSFRILCSGPCGCLQERTFCQKLISLGVKLTGFTLVPWAASRGDTVVGSNFDGKSEPPAMIVGGEGWRRLYPSISRFLRFDNFILALHILRFYG